MQVISKYELADSNSAYDVNGVIVATPTRRDHSVSIYFERGLNARVTLQGKIAGSWGEEAGKGYQGVGASELGVRILAYRTKSLVTDVYLGGTFSGDGRGATYLPAGSTTSGYELRGLAGWSGQMMQRPVFAEIQVAGIERGGLPPERRLDFTWGVTVAPRWQLLTQTYRGQAGQAQWSKAEISIVRELRSGLKFQAGWRAPTSGQNSQRESGPVIGVWRTH